MNMLHVLHMCGVCRSHMHQESMCLDFWTKWTNSLLVPKASHTGENRGGAKKNSCTTCRTGVRKTSHCRPQLKLLRDPALPALERCPEVLTRVPRDMFKSAHSRICHSNPGLETPRWQPPEEHINGWQHGGPAPASYLCLGIVTESSRSKLFINLKLLLRVSVKSGNLRCVWLFSECLPTQDLGAAPLSSLSVVRLIHFHSFEALVTFFFPEAAWSSRYRNKPDKKLAGKSSCLLVKEPGRTKAKQCPFLPMNIFVCLKIILCGNISLSGRWVPCCHILNELNIISV